MTNLKIYIKYADEFERSQKDLVVAEQCRMYFIEKQMQLIKNEKGKPGYNEIKDIISEQLKKTEDLNKVLKITKAQKQEQTKNYCASMYKKIMDAVKAPSCNKALAASKLQTMVNFIQILTIYGPLSPEWEKNCIII